MPECPGSNPCGCVATATAQIMKYWNYPVTGTGSSYYLHTDYGKLSANYGATVYHWDQMPQKVTGTNNAVATLIYHCGVSVRMDYGPSGSTASDPRNELVNYFRYSLKQVD